MSSTIFTAPQYDPRKARRRLYAVLAVLGVIVLGALLWWAFRFHGQKRVVSSFFDALQEQRYEEAYGIWMADPDWQQHPQKYERYPFSEFYIDWGPGGEHGLVRSYRIEGARRVGSGVVVVVNVNQRADPQAFARLWVQDDDRTLTFSPF